MAILKDQNPVIVLDFETTGLSPQYGDRAIEIGAVLNLEKCSFFPGPGQSTMIGGKVMSFIPCLRK